MPPCEGFPEANEVSFGGSRGGGMEIIMYTSFRPGKTWYDVEFYNASYFTEAGADHFKVMEGVIGHTVVDEEATKVNVGF